VFYDNKPVAVLKGTKDNANFGLILHKEKFLGYLHGELLKSDLYESYLGHTASSFEENETAITYVNTKDKKKTEHRIDGNVVVITTGRGTALRKKLNLTAKSIDAHKNILWVLLPKPDNKEIIPKGFRAYLKVQTLFIVHTNAEGMIQMAWGKKDESDLKLKDFGAKKVILLKEIPRAYKKLVETGYTETSKTQFLKLACDRLDKWHCKNILFLGDAAHTMSPVAGQGINLAIRDSIVAANHFIEAINSNSLKPEEVFANIQEERTKEVKIMQTFQKKFGFFLMGVPRPLSKVFFLCTSTLFRIYWC
jgi:2-polyprenyl-6-methoxyphenol hydroxylase-like FAD-dependent oxidoreductase